MVTLLIIGLCLWLYGMIRTLVVYLAIIATVVSLIVAEAAGLGFSALFWSESVRAFDGSEYWTSQFVGREGFKLWEAPAVPVIFFFDLVKKGFEFCWQVPNIFSIGIFAYWWYMMFQLWGQIVLPMLIPPKATSDKRDLTV